MASGNIFQIGRLLSKKSCNQNKARTESDLRAIVTLTLFCGKGSSQDTVIAELAY